MRDKKTKSTTISLKDLNLPLLIECKLVANGITSINSLCSKTQNELLNLQFIGYMSLYYIKKHLKRVGLSLAVETKNIHHKQIREWRKKVKEKYNGICAICGSSDRCQAHHIVPSCISEELRYNANNGILLCYKHHKMAHKSIRQHGNKILNGAQDAD